MDRISDISVANVRRHSQPSLNCSWYVESILLKPIVIHYLTFNRGCTESDFLAAFTNKEASTPQPDHA
jgi:hypothetical protein